MNLSTRFIAVPVIRQSDLSPFKTASTQQLESFTIYSENVYTKRLDFTKIKIKNQTKTYFVELQNNPFPDTRLQTGSIMIVEKDKAPYVGQIIIAWLEGEFVVRKYEMENVYPRLVCNNPDYCDVEVEPDMEFWVWGVVINVVNPY